MGVDKLTILLFRTSIVPLTVSLLVGEVKPMPTLPVSSILTRSPKTPALVVLKVKAPAVPDPSLTPEILPAIAASSPCTPPEVSKSRDIDEPVVPSGLRKIIPRARVALLFTTLNLPTGPVVPIPTLLPFTYNTFDKLTSAPPVAPLFTVKVWLGVVVPMPTLSLSSITNPVVEVAAFSTMFR